MTPAETHAWLTDVLGPMDLLNVNGMTVGVAPVLPAAVTVGFSEIDSGLVVDDPDADSAGLTEVRCEIICAADGATPQQRVMAVAGAWNTLVNAGIPGQPGTALPGLVNDPALTVHHGLLREPEIFDRGTPLVNEPATDDAPARMTLLLELVLLTDDEYELAEEQGLQVLERRLRRRQTSLGDWARE
ncbi:suppressor of fused domain protein [Corynebacterium sp. 20_84]